MIIRYEVSPLPLYYAGYAGAGSRWVFDKAFALRFKTEADARTWIEEFIAPEYHASFKVVEL